jgi:hypothetical protein
MAGYRDSKPRLGEGFAHDAKRIARAGMTMKEALQTSDAAQFIAADLRERDKLLESSLKAVRREDALGAQISWRHLCATKPIKNRGCEVRRQAMLAWVSATTTHIRP